MAIVDIRSMISGKEKLITSVEVVRMYPIEKYAPLIGVNNESGLLLIATSDMHYVGKRIRYGDRLVYVTEDNVEIEGVIKFCNLEV